MFIVNLCKSCFLVIRYRLFFIFGFFPGMGFLKWLYNESSIKQARRVNGFLQSMGPCFIKLGQLLSVRKDIFGGVYPEILAELQEKAQILPFKKLDSFIRQAIGDKIIDYPRLSGQIVATGSIAQVYKASIVIGGDTKQVAIKVLKPNIRKKFIKDINFLRTIGKLLAYRLKMVNKSKIIRVLDVLERISLFETDLRFEAAASDEMKEKLQEFNQGHHIIDIPKVYWQFCDKNVLVTDWVEGLKFNSDQLKNSSSTLKEKAITNVFRIFFYQVVRLGFFHGDLHPGNIIIKSDGSVALIDFGMIGRLGEDSKRQIFLGWKNFLNQKYSQAAKTHFEAGWVASKYNIGEMETALRALASPIFKNDNVDVYMGGLMEQLFSVAKMFGIEIQKELVLVQKNMILLEGCCVLLDSNIDIWQLTRNILNEPEFQLTAKDRVMSVQKNVLNHIDEFKESISNMAGQMLYNQNRDRRFIWLNYIIISLLLVIIFLFWKQI